jgi:hypothetical protein
MIQRAAVLQGWAWNICRQQGAVPSLSQKFAERLNGATEVKEAEPIMRNQTGRPSD